MDFVRDELRIASFDPAVAAFQACPELTPMTVELPSADGTVRVVVASQAVPAGVGAASFGPARKLAARLPVRFVPACPFEIAILPLAVGVATSPRTPESGRARLAHRETGSTAGNWTCKQIREAD